ncbi:hypothetical protein JIN84_02740 [Luteolibacter yonseiensis]|uniref:Uncharacterized protein n=1 Tax=Luteolibacter yonseiensis TaxID=1144680 RepID=A0A934R0J3_9BACT|nr:hypothetical protein [Luteolibacter yonseiensis]MBK1814514.1 hypothetical protein [Luteolibacter yonseiensis]
MKPSSAKVLLLVTALSTPLLHAQDAPARIREIEQKVLMKQYRDSVRALAASAGETDGSSPEAISKYVQWLVKVDSELDADAKASAVGTEDMRESASTLNDMAWRMITSPDAAGRHPEISLKLATIALELCGRDNELKSNTLDTRARALFLLGKREEAVAEQERAVAAATVAKKAGVEATLASYRTNQLPEISPPAGGEQINYWKLNNVPHSKEMQRIVHKLNRMIIPSVDFEDAPLEEVVAFLRTKSVELDTAEPDPERKGLNIVVRPYGGKLPPASPAPADASTRVKSLHLRNVPLGTVLGYLTQMTSMRYKVDDSAVTLVPASVAESELYTRSFHVPPDFPSLIASNSPSGADRPIQDLLKDNGILFGEGSSASLPGGGVLLVTNTPNQLDKLEQLIMWSIPETGTAKPVDKAPPDLTQRTLDKLNSIIIPSVDFDDVSLDEAVEFIRSRSIELDAAEPDPMLKGMDFVVRPRTGGGEAARIRNLHLRDIPIAQVLKHVCDATASRFKVERSIITLVPQADVEKELLTLRFKVPVDFASALQEESGAPADAPRPSILKLLNSNGIRFGEGCSALLTEEGLLLVTNTPDEVDKLEMLIQAIGGTSSPVAQDVELEVPTEGVTRITRKLREIVIPSIQLENVSLETAVELLRKKSVELDATEPDPSLKGVNLVIRPRPNDPEPLPIRSLRLRNVPLGEALKYVCQVTRMRYKVDDFAVMLVSQDSIHQELFTRTFSVPLDFTSILEPPSGSEEAAADPFEKKPPVTDRPPVRVPVQELLKANGILFGEGSSASLTSGGTLIVTNNPMELDKLEQLILAITPAPEPAKPVEEPLSGTAYLTNKLEKIVIPLTDFKDVSLEEAVDFLRKQAVELDTLEPDPGKKGLNFVIRKEAAATAPASIRIKDLSLRNTPIAVALKYICDAAGLGYRVDDFSVTILDPSVLEKEIYTRTFAVPAHFYSALQSASNANAAAENPAGQKTRPSVTELLKSNGIKFDKGTSATLNSTHLLVTNSANQLDKVETLVQLLNSIPPDQWKRARELMAPVEPSAR